jgi:hypothetical protein
MGQVTLPIKRKFLSMSRLLRTDDYACILASRCTGTGLTVTSTARVPGPKSTTSQACCTQWPLQPPPSSATSFLLALHSAVSHYRLPPAPAMAPVVGARPCEVSCMNGLTANLHLLLVAFYTPSASRYKILMEAKVFLTQTQVISIMSHSPGVPLRPLCCALSSAAARPPPRRLHRRDIPARRRAGVSHVSISALDCGCCLLLDARQTLRPQDIIDAIELHASQLACVMFRSPAHTPSRLE